MEEDPGVLGKLPRSRPGTRSTKRDTSAGAGKGPVRAASGPARAAKRAEARGSKAARPAAKAPPKPRKAPAKPRARRATPPPPPPPPPRGADPVGDVVRTGAKVAGAGFKVAGGLTRGVLKRLPRP